MTKKALINTVQKPKGDEFNTPTVAVKPLVPFLQSDAVYWECTDPGNSKITEVLEQNLFSVQSSHLDSGVDFLTQNPPFDYDIIITNPPYSIKTQFLERAFQLGKPFAFLLPITTLEGVQRGELFQKYGLQLLVINRRVQFVAHSKTGAWFNASWFCWKLLPRDLIFVKLPKYP